MIAEPTRVARLPRTPDARNFPVPWFVAWIDGKPDFRVVAPGKIEAAVAYRLCWMCGQKLTRHAAFVIGPMCAVNRVSAEPPNHIDCAEYALTHCPFLTTPRMVRRDSNLPEDRVKPAGEMIERNPGVGLMWVTKDWTRFSDGRGGLLFRIGEPADTRWYCEGRPATREEAQAAIESGLPILQEMAQKDPDPLGAQVELNNLVVAATKYLPVPA